MRRAAEGQRRAHPIRALGIALLVALAATPPASSEHVARFEIQWACGYGGGHPDQCGIDPIGGIGVQSVGAPDFTGNEWIEDDEMVLGVDHRGDARAYPIKMLDRHEIVNDVIGGEPVAVTYCPLCGSGISFLADVDIEGQVETLQFAASGYLFQHDLVMWDPQTDTLWTQIQGRPIGTLDGTRIETEHPDVRLTFVPTQVVSWGDWKAEHPGSRLLQPVPGFHYGAVYGKYDENCRFGISSQERCDVDGLHPKEQVIGATASDGSTVAFPLFGLARVDVAVWDHGNGSVVATMQDGLVEVFDAEGRSFARQGDGTYLDQDGMAWDLRTGLAEDGTQLPRADSLRLFWFAWQQHAPGTDVWLPVDAPRSGALDRSDNGKLPGFTIGIVAVLLLTVAAVVRHRYR